MDTRVRKFGIGFLPNQLWNRRFSGPPKRVYISTQHYAFKAADHMKVGRQESQVASLDLQLFDAWKNKMQKYNIIFSQMVCEKW